MDNSSVKLQFAATVYRDGIEPFTVTVGGRVAWAILSLIRADKRGCTPMDRPQPRWSDAIFKAKKLGFNIETIYERHGGSFSGNHGRYRLHDRVTVSGGTLMEYLASPDGRREFPNASFARVAA